MCPPPPPSLTHPLITHSLPAHSLPPSLPSLTHSLTTLTGIIKLVDDFDASYDYVANEGETFFFKTNLAAPRYRWVGCVQRGTSHGMACSPGPLRPSPRPSRHISWASAISPRPTKPCSLKPAPAPHALCRPSLLPSRTHSVVKAQLPSPGAPTSWPDVIPQHPKDLLQGAVALKGDRLVTRYLRDVTAGARDPQLGGMRCTAAAAHAGRW